MTVTKAQVNRYTSKLYRFLNDGHKIEFKKMRYDRGSIMVDTHPTTLQLDPRDQLVPTLIHETLHYFYPTASEEWVLKMEDKIFRQLTERQIRNILRCLSNNI